ncbi:STN domain-containing protein [Salinisphaera sp. Q1T1-3]|uniref:STN domain-containing protein n=1 Tax=Salinisphaera sp. Q1T1-3 TaxID=2321229 RepID=UPI000E7377C1|nr:STN domain-containing protein [Salinisphaera sp. Q1T1-3]RJS91427.1 hypothetical protein D3260_15615 [Salinisphaera sp. Q1T1-3]
MRHISRLIILTAILLFGARAEAACQPAAAHYDLPAQRLDTALQEFAHISGCPVNVNTQLLDGHKAPALQGRFTPSVALIRLVRGSGLEVHFDETQLAVNQDDRQQMNQRVQQLEARLKGAVSSRQIDAGTADDLRAQLEAASDEAGQLIRQQGFLSAAEKASYDRLFAYVTGLLAPRATPQQTSE